MSIYDFKSQRHIAIDESQWNKYKEYTKVDSDNKKFDDEKYDWKMVYWEKNDEKYGRIMVSEKFKIKRSLTMGEFYGGGIVD